ncbi:MAG: cytochrome C biogenesis protein CcdA [Rhodobacteraceae bacterium]|nr:MAG: cytochrome C biogenesis protein CcdA [Paracoccaceae bacterium]
MIKYLLFILMLATPLMAVQPDEILEDPVMEARAREISKGLRCLVCRNENIDDSDAELARDLRLLVRERLVVGDTDQEVEDFVVDRYGEYVLLMPVFNLSNAILWFAGPILLLIGGWVSVVFIRRKNTDGSVNDKLSLEEQAKLDALMAD